MKRTLPVLLLLFALSLTWASGAWFKGLAKDVTSAGTKEALSADTTPLIWLVIQVKSTNTDQIFVVTDSDIQITLEAPTAGQALPWYSPPPAARVTLSEIYVDSAVSGEGVNVHYIPTIQ